VNQLLDAMPQRSLKIRSIEGDTQQKAFPEKRKPAIARKEKKRKDMEEAAEQQLVADALPLSDAIGNTAANMNAANITTHPEQGPLYPRTTPNPNSGVQPQAVTMDSPAEPFLSNSGTDANEQEIVLAQPANEPGDEETIISI